MAQFPVWLASPLNGQPDVLVLDQTSFNTAVKAGYIYDTVTPAQVVSQVDAPSLPKPVATSTAPPAARATSTVIIQAAVNPTVQTDIPGRQSGRNQR